MYQVKTVVTASVYNSAYIEICADRGGDMCGKSRVVIAARHMSKGSAVLADLKRVYSIKDVENEHRVWQ